MTKDFIDLHPNLDWLGRADKYEDEIFEIINHIKLFDKFSMDEVRSLCRFMQCYAAPRDYALIEEGDAGDYLLLILSGEILVTKMTTSESVMKIAGVGIGGTLGEMSMIDGQPRFATCTTVLPTDFAVLTRESFNNVLIQMPRLGNKLLLTLLQSTTSRLRHACQQLVIADINAGDSSSI